MSMKKWARNEIYKTEFYSRIGKTENGEGGNGENK